MRKLPAVILSTFCSTGGCIGGVDTVRITSDPTDADLSYLEYESVPWSPRFVRHRAGKTPRSIPVAWFWLLSPLPYSPLWPTQKSYEVTIEKPGYRTITQRMGGVGSRGIEARLVSVRKGSRFGWGKTYEYHFRLESVVEIAEARAEELLDIRAAARLLGVSPMRVFKWMKEGRFPKPVTPARTDFSADGARWRRADIEAWKPEIREDSDD